MATELIVEWFHGMKITEVLHTCDDCGWKVRDLENRIDVEWWSDDRCGCFRRDE